MTPMRQVPLALGPDPVCSFDNFVVGANADALAALAGPLPQVPVYLWGPPGAGKTHLLNALADRHQREGARVMAFGAGDPAPWPLDETARLIVLDDCGRYDPAQQHAAFGLFVEAASLALPIVAAGRVPPVDLPVRDDLRSRLGWGLVFQLHPLSEEHVRALLRREADRRGVILSDEVMAYILTRFDRNPASLMNLLDRLDTYALSWQRPVTVPLLRQMLAEERAG